MKKSSLLLLDTSIVLKLIQEGLWGGVTEKYKVHVARSVFNEVQFIPDEEGFAVTVRLVEGPDLIVFDVPYGNSAAFKNQFKPSLFEKLDAGELESLTYLFSANSGFLISSSDRVVFRILGTCARGDQGISLEELLQATGLQRNLGWQYSKKFREEWTTRGFQEHLQGQAFKNGCSPESCAEAAAGIKMPTTK
jgi:hypothetical protein